MGKPFLFLLGALMATGPAMPSPGWLASVCADMCRDTVPDAWVV